MDPLFCYVSVLSLVMLSCLFLLCSLVVICWKKADLLALLFVVFSCVFCHFPNWCTGSGMVPDCIDS